MELEILNTMIKNDISIFFFTIIVFTNIICALRIYSAEDISNHGIFLFQDQLKKEIEKYRTLGKLFEFNNVTNKIISIRPPDKSAYLKIIFLISHPKHMLWVLKSTVSMRRFF